MCTRRAVVITAAVGLSALCAATASAQTQPNSFFALKPSLLFRQLPTHQTAPPKAPWALNASRDKASAPTMRCVMPVIVGDASIDPRFGRPVPAPTVKDPGVIVAPKCAPKAQANKK